MDKKLEIETSTLVAENSTELEISKMSADWNRDHKSKEVGYDVTPFFMTISSWPVMPRQSDVTVPRHLLYHCRPTRNAHGFLVTHNDCCHYVTELAF